MNNTMDSPQRNRPYKERAGRRNRKHGGIGCVIGFVLLLVSVGATAAVWGPDLLNQLASQPGAFPVVLNDHTSPERLAAHRAQQLAQLNTYGWVNQEAGVAHIPIDISIDLV
jgi:hypothetical protein